MRLNGYGPPRRLAQVAAALCFTVAVLALLFHRFRLSRLEFPIPKQYAQPAPLAIESSQPETQAPFLSMSDDDLESHMVRDINDAPKGAEARWTNAHPAFKIRLATCQDLSFYAKFLIADSTFRDTGPVTLTALIGDTALAKEQFRSPGPHAFRFPAPSGLVCKSSPVLIGLDIDPVWVAKDGNRLGVLLYEIGFEKNTQ